MYDCALFLVTRPGWLARLSALFNFARPLVRKRLYLSLPEQVSLSPRTVAEFYHFAEVHCRTVDVRLLLPKAAVSSEVPLLLSRQADVLLVDDASLQGEQVRELARQHLAHPPSTVICVDHFSEESNQSDQNTAVGDKEEFAAVAMGGTFDRLHNGHKVLLSVAALLTTRMLTVGMTTSLMLTKKYLAELIQPLHVRSAAVRDFLVDIRPGLLYHIVPLTDPYGPPAHVDDYQAIVGTEDTLIGCHRVNEIRAQQNLPLLHVRTVPLVREEPANPADKDMLLEAKISSSNGRLRLLGTALQSPVQGALRARPYVLGLTGGTACGKTSVAYRLKLMGAGVVNCDALGHQVYEPNAICHGAIIKCFGEKILSETGDGRIDRSKLGNIVFNDSDSMDKLNAIVWPEICKLAELQIRQLFDEQGCRVVVLDAAVLLEAGWQMLCNEVWLCLLPRQEAIARVQKRNGLPVEEATARVNSQPTDAERILQASVPLCTLWTEDVTQMQLEKAWHLLQERIQTCESKL